MQVSAHLNFNGQCREAFEYYSLCIGGKLTFLMAWGESPMAEQMPQSMHSKICHATFQLEDTSFSGSDGLPGHSVKAQGFALTIQTKSVEEAERIFAGLSAGGSVQMPLQKTFWAQRFGQCVDQFGIPWMINCETAA